jgi:hypothetical protein
MSACGPEHWRQSPMHETIDCLTSPQTSSAKLHLRSQARSHLGVEAAKLAAALRFIHSRWLLLLLLCLTCHRQTWVRTTLLAAAPGQTTELALMLTFGKRPCCVEWCVCCACWAVAPL